MMETTQTTKACPFCGESIRAEAIKCRYCHSFINEDAAKVTNEDNITDKNTFVYDANNMPEELKYRFKIPRTAEEKEIYKKYNNGWNEGAFWWGVIWGFAHKAWKPSLILLPIVLLIPKNAGTGIAGGYFAFYGNKYAWKSKKWDSMEQFLKSQRKWAISGRILVVVTIILVVLYIVGSSS